MRQSSLTELLSFPDCGGCPLFPVKKNDEVFH